MKNKHHIISIPILLYTFDHRTTFFYRPIFKLLKLISYKNRNNSCIGK